MGFEFEKGENGESFAIIESVKDYVKQLQSNSAETVIATKAVSVKAEYIDETNSRYVDVYTADGNKECEKQWASPGNWIVTRIDAKTKEPVIDAYNHMNQYVVSNDTMWEKYDMPNMTEQGIVKAKGTKQVFIKTDRNISIMANWGKQMLLAGAYLNITNMSDIYGVASIEFASTYEILEHVTAASAAAE